MEMGQKRDLVSWSLKRLKLSFICLRMVFFPIDYCFAAVIRACSVPENASIGDAIFWFIIKSGYVNYDVCVGCAF